jgi:Raf kinase inhibitor-like YbhB/YbcL family protein
MFDFGKLGHPPRLSWRWPRVDPPVVAWPGGGVVHLRSDSFLPYHHLDPRLAFGTFDPATHVRLAGNRNPHLAWSDVPPSTRSLALLCWDADAPTRPDDVNQERRTVPLDLPRAEFFHWVVSDLPADLRSIAEGSHSAGVTPRGKPLGRTPSGGTTGLNSYTEWFANDADMSGDYAGYDGPCPPWNDERVHGYTFALYALDTPSVGLSGPFRGPELRQAMSGHVLAEAAVVGLYAIRR